MQNASLAERRFFAHNPSLARFDVVISSVLRPDVPAKDTECTLPTADLRLTYVHCLARRAPPRRAQSFAGASGFRIHEVTAEIQDAPESLKCA